MRVFLILLLVFLSAGTISTYAQEASGTKDETTEKMTTYFFIRHAEKDQSDPMEKDPELTPLGRERARKWAEILKEVPFDQIYSSNYKRTLQTALPIAEKQGLPILTYDPRKLYEEGFQQKTKGRNILIVGHSNTNPKFVNLILGNGKYQDIDEMESGSLFIVTVSSTGEKTCQVLYIN